MDTELDISPKRTDARAVFRVEEAFNASVCCVCFHDGMGTCLSHECPFLGRVARRLSA